MTRLCATSSRSIASDVAPPPARLLERFPRRAHVLITAFAFGVLCGCGSDPPLGGGKQPPSIGPSILTQPASQTVPLDQAATFTVTADGSGPLSYQWSENGTVIAGATAASYTVADVTIADSGMKFTVRASNSDGSITSSAAALTVGPRSPMAGDLRFQRVDAASQVGQGGGLFTGILPGEQIPINNQVGSPLELGNGNCATGIEYDCTWFFEVAGLPAGQSGLNAVYQSGAYLSFDADMAALLAPNLVITSLDFQPANSAYAFAAIQGSQASGFDMKHEVISPASLVAAVAEDAAQSRIVTAVSFDASGQANVLSWGWQGNTKTTYDTDVITVAADDVADAATNLAASGYIITAFGGDTTNGFVLVGTKVQGDTLARPILVQMKSEVTPASGELSGYAPVVWLDTFNGGVADTAIVVYEK